MQFHRQIVWSLGSDAVGKLEEESIGQTLGRFLSNVDCQPGGLDRFGACLAVFGVQVQYQYLAPAVRLFERGAYYAKGRIKHSVNGTAYGVCIFC